MRSNRTRVFGIIATILVHALIILPFVIKFQKLYPKEEHPDNDVRVEIRLIPLNKSQPKPTESGTWDTPTPQFAPDPRICEKRDSTYIGVGFMYTPGSNLIYHVPQGYPAYLAGIREGDILEDPFPERDKDDYEIVYVQRSQDHLHFRIKAEKICFQKDKPH